jgi:hypothetical protein
MIAFLPVAPQSRNFATTGCVLQNIPPVAKPLSIASIVDEKQ